MRVNVDDQALTEPRMRRMARHLTKLHAREVPWQEVLGRILPVWMLCYQRRTPVLEVVDIDVSAEFDGFAEAMLAAGMARAEGEGGHVYVCGVSERIEFLERQAEKGRKSGQVRKHNAAQEQLFADNGTGVQPMRKQTFNQRLNERSRVGSTYSLAPDQAPDQALAPDQDRVPAVAGAPSGSSEQAPRSEGKAHNAPEQSAPENPRPRGPEPADEAVTLAFLLLSLCIENSPHGRIAKQTERQREETAMRWAVPIDKLHRLDKFEWGAIESMIRWCQRDHFWRGVILGGDNLRDKWDKMAAQRMRPSTGHPNAPPRDFNAELDAAAENLKSKANNAKEPAK
jgi:hypothetical protein